MLPQFAHLSFICICRLTCLFSTFSSFMVSWTSSSYPYVSGSTAIQFDKAVITHFVSDVSTHRKWSIGFCQSWFRRLRFLITNVSSRVQEDCSVDSTALDSCLSWSSLIDSLLYCPFCGHVSVCDELNTLTATRHGFHVKGSCPNATHRLHKEGRTVRKDLSSGNQLLQLPQFVVWRKGFGCLWRHRLHLWSKQQEILWSLCAIRR